MTRFRRAGATLALVAALAGCGGGDPEVVASAAPGVEVPPRDADLAPAGWAEASAWIAREAADGRPVLLNVFASWCGPCEDEAPILRELSQELSGVTFLGVDHQDRLEEGRAFVEEHRLPYATLYDIGGEVARAIGSHGMPTTALFDADGRLVDLHVGPLTEDELRERLATHGLVADGE